MRKDMEKIFCVITLVSALIGLAMSFHPKPSHIPLDVPARYSLYLTDYKSSHVQSKQLVSDISTLLQKETLATNSKELASPTIK